MEPFTLGGIFFFYKFIFYDKKIILKAMRHALKRKNVTPLVKEATQGSK